MIQKRFREFKNAYKCLKKNIYIQKIVLTSVG